MTDVHAIIRAALEDERVTQAELARRLGTNRSVVCRYVSPKYDRHSTKTLRRIAHALGRELTVEFRKDKDAA